MEREVSHLRALAHRVLWFMTTVLVVCSMVAPRHAARPAEARASSEPSWSSHEGSKHATHPTHSELAESSVEELEEARASEPGEPVGGVDGAAPDRTRLAGSGPRGPPVLAVDASAPAQAPPRAPDVRANPERGPPDAPGISGCARVERA